MNEHAVASFAEAAYSKANIAVVADGANQIGLTKWIEPFFKSVPESSATQLTSAASKYHGGEQRIAQQGPNALVLGFSGASLASDSPETDVLVALLGGESNIKWAPGFTLLSKAAASAPGAHVSATNYAYSDAGLLTIQINGSASAVRKAAEESVKALKSVAESPVSKEDLTKAIAKAKFDLLARSEVSGTGLVHAGANLIHGGKPLEVVATIKALESVTPEKLKAVRFFLSFLLLSPLLPLSPGWTRILTSEITRLRSLSWRARLALRRLETCSCCPTLRSLASRYRRKGLACWLVVKTRQGGFRKKCINSIKRCRPKGDSFVCILVTV